jgi:hypothetical protein
VTGFASTSPSQRSPHADLPRLGSARRDDRIRTGGALPASDRAGSDPAIGHPDAQPSARTRPASLAFSSPIRPAPAIARDAHVHPDRAVIACFAACLSRLLAGRRRRHCFLLPLRSSPAGATWSVTGDHRHRPVVVEVVRAGYLDLGDARILAAAGRGSPSAAACGDCQGGLRRFGPAPTPSPATLELVLLVRGRSAQSLSVRGSGCSS